MQINIVNLFPHTSTNVIGGTTQTRVSLIEQAKPYSTPT